MLGGELPDQFVGNMIVLGARSVVYSESPETSIQTPRQLARCDCRIARIDSHLSEDAVWTTMNHIDHLSFALNDHPIRTGHTAQRSHIASKMVHYADHPVQKAVKSS